MKIKSYVREGWRLRPIELEVSLVPGIPQIHFLGLPDQALRESVLRIKSAIRLAGFEFPATRQVIVNLTPSHLKKSSQGLDFPVAAAILWMTGQILPVEESPTLYGALGLSGDVIAPSDLDEVEDCGTPVWTGIGSANVPFTLMEVSHLSQLGSGSLRKQTEFHEKNLVPPNLGDLKYSRREARMMAAVSAAEVPVLLAGPQGTGKSTLAKTLARIRPDPSPELFLEIRRVARQMNVTPPSWRPIVAPHQSTPPLALFGGGIPVRAGEVTRAHGGTLILDEYLEFPRACQEALREPVETGTITVARVGSAVELPSKFLLVATTNLCNCGLFVPLKVSRCRCGATRLKRYLDRMSGPVLDRFGVVFFITGDKETAEIRDVSAPEIQKMALEAAKRIVSGKTQMGSKKIEIPPMGDRRRRHVRLIARALAAIDGNETAQPNHYEEALHLSFYPVEQLRMAGAGI